VLLVLAAARATLNEKSPACAVTIYLFVTYVNALCGGALAAMLQDCEFGELTLLIAIYSDVLPPRATSNKKSAACAVAMHVFLIYMSPLCCSTAVALRRGRDFVALTLIKAYQ